MIQKKKSKKKEEAKKEKKPFSLLTLLWIVLGTIGGVVLVIFSLPWLIYLWFRYKALQKSAPARKAYWSYTSAMYLLNQTGYTRGNSSPLQFAKHEIDPYFRTDFSAFVQVYLKSKYSTEPLTTWEEKIVSLFYPPFERAVKNKIPFKQRFSKFLNFYRTINYFTKPKV